MNEQPKELFIDVSDYEPPQPFEEVIQLLLKMKTGEYIRMLHRKKPVPLLQFLQENGFNFKVSQNKSTSWEVFIWSKKDLPVNNYCSGFNSSTSLNE